MMRKKDCWAVVMMHAGKWAALMNGGYDTRWFYFTRDWTTDTLTRDDTEGPGRPKSEIINTNSYQSQRPSERP